MTACALVALSRRLRALPHGWPATNGQARAADSALLYPPIRLWTHQVGAAMVTDEMLTTAGNANAAGRRASKHGAPLGGYRKQRRLARVRGLQACRRNAKAWDAGVPF